MAAVFATACSQFPLDADCLLQPVLDPKVLNSLTQCTRSLHKGQISLQSEAKELFTSFKKMLSEVSSLHCYWLSYEVVISEKTNVFISGLTIY